MEAVKKFFSTFSKLFIIIVIICAGIAFGLVYGLIKSTSTIDVSNLRMDFTSFIYYVDPETGEEQLLQALYDDENRVWADLEDIPQDMQDAFVAIEDERFYEHPGFDIKRTMGAALNLISRNQSVYGGSTITQQLVKNITGEEETSIKRKIQEIYRAYQLEKQVNSKSAILELYLNTIYLSQQTNGVAAAAQVYFDKNVSDLSLAECACIAGITQYPVKYDPYLNPKDNKEKQEVVLQKMLELGYITQEEHDAAVAEELVFQRSSEISKMQYSYFIDTVIDEVIADLMEKEHYSEVVATRMLYSGGLHIYTTIDPAVQKKMEEYFTEEGNFPALSTEESKLQSAMVVLDPATGGIRGIVGGIGPKEGSRTLNRALAVRPPGSSIKPIAVYAPALEDGVISISEMIEDTPVQYGDWRPRNADGMFHGPVTLRYAVARSLNIPAIKVLDELGINRSFDFLVHELGITSLVDSDVRDGQVFSDKNLSSLALGGLTDGISPLEMAGAYIPFDNKGVYKQPHSYTKITDYNGELLMQKSVTSKTVISEITAYQMTGLLQEVVSSGTGGGAGVSGMPTAGKTGTTSNNLDKWFVGYTPYYVAAVWTGFDQPKAIAGGANPSVATFRNVMTVLHADLEKKSFPIPANMVQVTICTKSGKKATEACKNDIEGAKVVTEYYKKGAQPRQECDYEHLIEEAPLPEEEELPPVEEAPTEPALPEEEQPQIITEQEE